MLFLVALLLLTFPSTFAKCPTGTFQGLIPGLCYLTSYTRMTWLHAEYYCNQQGGHLASVQDPYTNKYIAQQLGGYPSVWLGGTTMYVDAQPQFSNSLCLSTNPHTYNWTAQPCSNTYPSVCEIYENQNGQPQVKPCPDDWIFIQQEEKCYRYFDNENGFTFHDALQFCNNASGQLASVHNFGVAAVLGGQANLYLQQVYNTTKPDCGGFIGLVRSNVDDSWQWVDGTPFDYTYWINTNWVNPDPRDIYAGFGCSAADGLGFYSIAKYGIIYGAFCEMPAKSQYVKTENWKKLQYKVSSFKSKIQNVDKFNRKKTI
uniref:C-type lectin domain-containing protein n=1 Tax=Acrobeloides nanus TaxID=290746 RepID=A0A914ELM8_9BILA